MISNFFSTLFFLLSFAFTLAQSNNAIIDSLMSQDNITFYQNIEYGENERNKLDIIIPKSNSKTPLVIYLHGGGYKGGKKEHSFRKNSIGRINEILNNKIAFATINYSFLNNEDGLISSLNDAKLALQFLKYNHNKFNLDKNRVVIWGVSSGANSVLWLGLSDDMADLKSENKVLRESTRVQGIVSVNGAHSFNSQNWKKMINMSDKIFDFMIKRFLKYPGMDVDKWLVNYKLKKYQEAIDYFDFMDSSDPPMLVANYGDMVPKSISSFNHHPIHAKYLKQRADSLSIENYVFAPKLGIESKDINGILDFILKQLTDR